MFQAHVVSAFEQSLSNMTNRLQHLTATAEAKVGLHPSPWQLDMKKYVQNAKKKIILSEKLPF